MDVSIRHDVRKKSSMKCRKQKPQKRRGQSLVEFTVLLPLLLMMISGLIEFGFMLNYYLDMIDAAREAARFAADDDPIRLPSGAYLDPNPGFLYTCADGHARFDQYRLWWADYARSDLG